MEILTTTMDQLPAPEWANVIATQLPGDLTVSLGPIIGSLLSLVLPPGLVDELCTVIAKFLGGFADPTDVIFLKEHYIPVYRNATAKIMAHMGPLKKLEVARKGLGGFTKFLYYTLWQEQIVKLKIFLDPLVNELGADLMPGVFGFADLLSGFSDTDGAVRHCGDDVYPGAGWCRRKIPHAKSHEIAANAFYDLVELGDYLGGLYEMQEGDFKAFEDRAKQEDPNYHHKAMAFATATHAIHSTVRAFSASQSAVAQEATISFWRTVALAALAILAVTTVSVCVLLRKVQRVQKQGSVVALESAYSKLRAADV